MALKDSHQANETKETMDVSPISNEEHAPNKGVSTLERNILMCVSHQSQHFSSFYQEGEGILHSCKHSISDGKPDLLDNHKMHRDADTLKQS